MSTELDTNEQGEQFDQTEKFENKILELRITEIEIRNKMLIELAELNRRLIWKKRGCRSFQDYCSKDLGYRSQEVREILEKLGLIMMASQLVSGNPAVQMRIEKLKDWRKQAARIRGVAAFKILPNRTLMAIAENAPSSLEALRQIRGVGPRKLEEFGRSVLDATQGVGLEN